MDGSAALLIEKYFTNNTAGGNIQLNNLVVVLPTSRIVRDFLNVNDTYGSIDKVSGTIQAFGGAFSTIGNPTNINIAQQGIAVNQLSFASSTFDNVNHPPSKANDGVYREDNMDDFWACANNGDIGVWWSVDLGQALPLGKVRVNYRYWLSGQSAVYHLVPLSVTVHTSNDNINWTTVLSKSSNVPQEGVASSVAIYEYPTGGGTASYVRLLFEDGGSTYSGYKLIELAEVEIIPPGMAVNHPSLASSTFDNVYNPPPKANDGVCCENNVNDYWACANNEDVGAWWSVDLGQVLPLDKVRINYQHWSNGVNSLYHFVPSSVRVQTSDDNINWTSALTQSTNVPQEGSVFSKVDSYDYPVLGKGARYVRLLFQDGGSSYCGFKLIEFSEVDVIPCLY